jgi:YD repeat-containing protein
MTDSSGNFTDTLNYSYDALQRLISQTTVRTGLILAKEYSFKNLSGNRTTTQISSYTAKVNGTAVDSYTYTYDSLGNITVINRSGNLPVCYTYDAQNQLVSVLEGDFRYDFTYDTYGNILSVEYAEDYTDEVMSSNTYTYGNAQWVDQLTKFNGHSIIYDGIGNPLSYYNGSSYTFT